jgi:7-cyano-7-deazaguanine synthase
MTEKAIAIVSGGMDSTVLAYLLAESNDIHMVSFNYGQRHIKELDYAILTAQALGVPHTIVPMEFMAKMLHGSALTSDIEVPEGHYASDNMRITVVPNRNSIMLNIATGIAVAEKANFVATAVHAGDHAVYPDCRPEFISITSDAMLLANEGFIDPMFGILAPFVHIGKHDIAKLGADLKVPFQNTWSCYVGGDIHCGKCGTCVERKEAFALANVPDPTQYTDENFGVAAFRG